MPELQPMTWLALGYGLVLVVIAYGIDALARRASRRVEQHHTGGFVYHPDHDAWVCPQDQWLWPSSFDPDNRVMRYRAAPTVCNVCPVKDQCTSSDAGREVQRAVDPWPFSQAARFHRGLACTVTVLAVAWPAFTALGSAGPDRWVLVVQALVAALASAPLWSHLVRTPADPSGVFVRSADANAAERQTIAAEQQRRRTRFASDRRPAPDQPAAHRKVQL